MLVEGWLLTVCDHNHDLSLFFWILDFVPGFVLSFLLRLFVVRPSDHRRRRVREDFGMKWYYSVSSLFLFFFVFVSLSKNFLVAAQYCYSFLFKLIILIHYLCCDRPHVWFYNSIRNDKQFLFVFFSLEFLHLICSFLTRKKADIFGI